MDVRGLPKACGPSNFRFLVELEKYHTSNDTNLDLTRRVEEIVRDLVDCDIFDPNRVALFQQLAEILKTEDILMVDSRVFLEGRFIEMICETFKSPGLELESLVREILIHLTYIEDVADKFCTIEFMDLCAQYLDAEPNVLRCEQILAIVNHIARMFAERFGAAMLPFERIASTSATDGVLNFVRQVVQADDDTQGVIADLIEMCSSVTEKIRFSKDNVRKLFYIMACTVSHRSSDVCFILDDKLGYDEPLFNKVFRYFREDDSRMVQYLMKFASTVFCHSQTRFGCILRNSLPIESILKILFSQTDENLISCCLECVYFYITSEVEQLFPIDCSEATVSRLLEYLNDTESSFNVKRFTFYILFHLSQIEPRMIPYLLDNNIIQVMDEMLSCSVTVVLQMARNFSDELEKAGQLEHFQSLLAETDLLEHAKEILAEEPDENLTYMHNKHI